MQINASSINTNLIEKSLLDLKNEIINICTTENISISYLQPKINTIEELVSTLDTISPFIEDNTFTKEFTALNLISQRIFNNQFEFLENESFRSSQIDSLYNMGLDFNLNSSETIQLDNSIEKDIVQDLDISNVIEKTPSKSNKPINNNSEKIKKESEKLVDEANYRLETYFKDPKLMKEYLEYMSKFYNYSERNSALIQKQFEGAKAVGSFKFWSNQGYKINKGEKGIKILTPVETTYFEDSKGNKKQLKYATKQEKEDIKNKKIETYKKKYFKVGYVFDVSQTNAPLEDLPKLFPNRWIEDEVKDYDKMYKSLETIADKIGVKIIEPKYELGVVKGVSYPETKEVALNPRNSQLQNVKTLIHELAHAKLHTLETRNNYFKSEREYQAEMIAYSTCSYFGLDTSDYSLNYLDNWTKNIDLDDCIDIIKEVKSTTAEYIEIIEETLTNEKDLSLSLEKEVKKDKNKEKEIAPSSEKDFENKLLVENLYVKFNSSKAKEFGKDDIYDFKTANELVSLLSEKYVSLNTPMATNFEIHSNENCNKCIYRGTMDIGNGLDYDLKNHMYKKVKNEPNLSEQTKKSYLKLFAPKQKINHKSMD